MDEAQQFASNFAAAATPALFDLLSRTFLRAMDSRVAKPELESLEPFPFRRQPLGTATNWGDWSDLNALSGAISSAIVRVQSRLGLEEEYSRLPEILDQLAHRTAQSTYRNPIFLDDVLPLLGRFAAQLALLDRLELLCPAVSFGPDIVPASLHVPNEQIDRDEIEVLVLLQSARPPRSSFIRRLFQIPELLNEPIPLVIKSLQLDDVAKFMTEPLSRFLGFRLFWSNKSPTPPPSLAPPRTPNAEVATNENGWLVVYSPTFIHEKNGFGGPTTPVRGYLPTGTQRLGISRPNKIIWDDSSWDVTLNNRIYLPIP
jgi:hypothetical protein